MPRIEDDALRQPIVTGTSVLALKFKDGIMMAADTLGAFIVLSGWAEA